MGLNLSKDLLNAADKVTVTVNPAKLGPIQRKALARVADHGVCHEQSVPHRVAFRLRETAGLPVIHVSAWGWTRWSNVPPGHVLFEKMVARVVAHALTDNVGFINAAYAESQRKRLEDSMALLRSQPARGAVHVGQGDRMDFVKDIGSLGAPTEPFDFTSPLDIEVELEDDTKNFGRF